MKKMLIVVISLLMLSGCILSTTKIKLTDDKGNSVTISDQGIIGLDLQAFEKDGYKVEVMEDEVTKEE